MQLGKGGILRSPKDNSILSILSSLKTTSQESSDLIESIESPENIPLAKAIIGDIEPAKLDEDSRTNLEKFKSWHEDKSKRTFKEQVSARRKLKRTQLSEKLIELHSQGKIQQESLYMYGISGQLPDQGHYANMDEAERCEMWRRRMEYNIGRDWPIRFREANIPIPDFASNKVIVNSIEWEKYGF